MLFNLNDKKAKSAHSVLNPISRFIRDMDGKNLPISIGQILPGEFVVFFNDKEWSNIGLIEYFIHHHGPGKISICTWSLTRPPVLKLLGMAKMGLITDCRFMIDKRVPRINKDAFALIEQSNFMYKLKRCHAKIIIYEGKSINMALITSANFTRTPTIECGVIISQQETVQHVIESFNDLWN